MFWFYLEAFSEKLFLVSDSKFGILVACSVSQLIRLISDCQNSMKVSFFKINVACFYKENDSFLFVLNVFLLFFLRLHFIAEKSVQIIKYSVPTAVQKWRKLFAVLFRI